MRRALAIYPGTFDPVHAGHLAVARAARDLLGATVLMVPDAAPMHRVTPHFDFLTRLTLLRVALRDEEGVVADDRSARLSHPTRTLELVRDIASAGGERPYLLISDEIAATLPDWEDPLALVRAARLVVFHRPGERPLDRRALGRLLGSVARRVAYIDTPLPDCRATTIRAALAAGADPGDCLPPSVAAALAALTNRSAVAEMQP
jgi:nicotinate-nucleotide adenylyltransferase